MLVGSSRRQIHSVFWMDWLKVLALCTYLRGRHPPFSTDQLLGTGSSWTGDGCGIELTRYRVSPTALTFCLRKDARPGLRSLLASDHAGESQTVSLEAASPALISVDDEWGRNILIFNHFTSCWLLVACTESQILVSIICKNKS